MDDIYKAVYLSKPANPIDCNKCAWLNITEEEQEKLKGMHKGMHICKFYMKRVIHNTNRQTHASRLHPCRECYEDGLEHFIEREMI